MGGVDGVRTFEIIEVDGAALARDHHDTVVAFERAMWEEQEPGEPGLSEEVAIWLATRPRPNMGQSRWVALDAGGEIAGLALLDLFLADNLHLGRVDVRVLTGHRRHGLGRALLLEAAARARDNGRTTLTRFTWDLVPAGEPFARAAGGAPAQLVRRSELDLRVVDRSLVQRWLDVPDSVRAAYELWFVSGAYPVDAYDAIADVEDVMNTAPHDDLDLDDERRDAAWVAQREEQFASSPGERWTLFVRERATARLVGYTQVFFYEDWAGHVDQGNTGVHADHRGHGLGRWLKAAMLDRIFREHPEMVRARTTNAFSNAPMLSINNELGFTVTATQTTWQARVDDVLRAAAARSPQDSD